MCYLYLNKMPKALALVCLVVFIELPGSSCAAAMEQAAVGELFTYKIEPQLFNWTHQVISEQYRYRPSLRGYPDLPSWMRFMYSNEYNAGYLYGTPPDSLAGKTVDLDIVCLNKQNHDTHTAHIAIFVAHKFPSTNVIHMKIDNLNWVHMMDPGRVENLLNIFRKELWPESERDLSLIFMESAVNMGGRLPLRPQQHEGVIVHLGSFAPFSARIRELQDEVRPLYKLTTCTYKRTSVQKIFENAGFKLDWCAFKTNGADIKPEILFHNHGLKAPSVANHNHWQGIYRDEVPSRNYIDEYAFAFAIPGMIFAVLLGILSAVFCLQDQKFVEPAPYTVTTSTVQMVQCSDSTTDQPVITLRSLRDPNCLLDNDSTNSQSSPTNSYYPADSPSNTYMRPKPPPFKSSTLTRNGVDI